MFYINKYRILLFDFPNKNDKKIKKNQQKTKKQMMDLVSLEPDVI
jgi:hypothetical protein